MKLDLTLNPHEIEMKKFYETEGRRILSEPISFAACVRLCEEHPEYPEFQREYEEHGFDIKYQENSLRGELVGLNPHERYGYPILHTHAYVEMIYVYSGHCMHFIEDSAFEMKNGDLCFVSPQAKHAIAAVEDDALVINVLLGHSVLDKDFLQLLREKELLAQFFENILFRKDGSPYILFPTGEDSWMHDTVFLMCQEAERREFRYDKAILLYTKQMLLHIARNYQLTAIVAEKKKNEQDVNMAAILTYIAANYNRLTLPKLAAFFNYNEKYMSRKLKYYTGKSFQALINEMQMIRAAELLEAGELNQTQIAREIGCFDSSHFMRKFKKYYGKTPQEYMQRKQS